MYAKRWLIAGADRNKALFVYHRLPELLVNRKTAFSGEAGTARTAEGIVGAVEDCPVIY